MKLILIDGGPASGKNTLGNLLVRKFQEQGVKTILLDLDTYVEKINPSWVWDNDQQKEKDQLNARLNFAKDIDKYLEEDFIVITIGERFLTKDDITCFVSRLRTTCPIYLYHLSVPFVLRKQRLHQRGPHSLIDLGKDQNDRDAIKVWPGQVYENINSEHDDVENLFKLMQDGKGLINVSLFTK